MTDPCKWSSYPRVGTPSAGGSHPTGETTGREGVPAVADQGEHDEAEPEDADLLVHRPLHGVDELRQEGDEEQRRLGVQQIDEDSVPVQP